MDQIVDNSPLLEGDQMEFPELNNQTQPQWSDSAEHHQLFMQSEGFSSYSYVLENQHLDQQLLQDIIEADSTIADSKETDYHELQQLPAGPPTAVPFAIPTGGYQSPLIVSQSYSEPMVWMVLESEVLEANPIIHENIQIRTPNNSEPSQFNPPQYKIVYMGALIHPSQTVAHVDPNVQEYMQQPVLKFEIQMNTQTQTPPILSAPLLESRNHQENSQIPHCSRSQKEVSEKHCTRKSVRQYEVEYSEFQCDICGRFFASQRGLTQHKKWAHTDGSIFPCPTCGKKYNSEEKLNKHLVRHNTTEKPFQCKTEACKKQYWHKLDLERHTLRHSKTNPFTCDKCQKEFTRQDHLVVHLRRHNRRKKRGRKRKENAIPVLPNDQ